MKSKPALRLLATAALFLTMAGSGCVRIDGDAEATFDRRFTVSEPVRLEVENRSGSIEISSGPSGEVRIYGEVRHGWPFGVPADVEEVTADPPVEQSGSTIRITRLPSRLSNITVSYRITVPEETTVEARTGSGRIELRGTRGTARLQTGSGRILAEDVGRDVQAETGSGRIELRRIDGFAYAQTGSGSVTLEDIRGDVRASTGSGSIRLEQIAGRTEARTGSGNIRAAGIHRDFSANTGSGSVILAGDPARGSFWEASASSGNITLEVPGSASFRLIARSRSRVDSELPLHIEYESRRELRGRLGDGEARIELSSASGRIRIR